MGEDVGMGQLQPNPEALLGRTPKPGVAVAYPRDPVAPPQLEELAQKGAAGKGNVRTRLSGIRVASSRN